MALLRELEAVAERVDFSGAVIASVDGNREVELARGMAHRALGHPIALDTQFATASATKGLVALTIASLIESGRLAMDTTVGDLLPGMLDDVDPRVTVEQLLGHTSGVGDYLDEDELDDIDAYVLAAPVHTLVSPADYLPLITGLPQRSEPGDRFAYNNSGYVILSLAIDAASDSGFHDTVRARVLRPAAMHDTDFLRSDDLPARAALGYLADGRSNVLHLPVIGGGDGGIYTTVADIERMWQAMFAGHIVAADTVSTLVTPRSEAGRQQMRYGLGFWLSPQSPTVVLVGCDAGVSFRSAYDPVSATSYTVISNTSDGAWPLARVLDAHLPVR